MLKGCPQIYLSDVRHFSRCLLVVRYRTRHHQTTYTCFCTQEFSWDSLPSARANRCCNNCLRCYRDNNFSYQSRSQERTTSWTEPIPNQAAVSDPYTNRIGIFHCWRCAKDYNQSYPGIIGSSWSYCSHKNGTDILAQ